MSKWCGNCGAELADNARFCEKCGAPLQEAPPPKLFCHICGAEYAAGAKFCEKCGNPIDQTVSAQASMASAQSLQAGEKKKMWPWLVAIGAVLLVGFFIVASLLDFSVEEVKNGCLTQYSSTITVGEAFENRFDNCKWSSSDSSIVDGAHNVYFSGDDTAMNTHWEVAFYSQDDWFEVDSISIDGEVHYDDTVIYYLLDYVYTGNLDKLYTDMGLALWDAIFSY